MHLVVKLCVFRDNFCAVGDNFLCSWCQHFVHLVVKFCATMMAVAELGGGACQNGELSAT